MTSYQDFLDGKTREAQPVGIDSCIDDLTGYSMFPFQEAVTLWALRLGRCAIWADCGLGKTRMAIAWADRVRQSTGGSVLILTPLAVAPQFVEEGESIGVGVNHVRTGDVAHGINVMNYERLHHIDPGDFVAVVCDESSCLKDYTSKTRNALIQAFQDTRYRLALTATPSPNDVMELGNHSEFLGVLSRTEMLARYFVHDGGETQKWRLKRHAFRPFWEWVSGWAASFRKPSDIGFDDDGYNLPPLNIESVMVETVGVAKEQGRLFAENASGIHEQRRARKETTDSRVLECAKIANSHGRPFIAWCDMNEESRKLAESIDGAVEITGSMSLEEKESRIRDFSTGRARALVTKPSICGWGLNWQHCSDVAFVGLSHSFESWYQAIRRTWRFGQSRDVICHIITSDVDGAVISNFNRKQAESEMMADAMSAHVERNIAKVTNEEGKTCSIH